MWSNPKTGRVDWFEKQGKKMQRSNLEEENKVDEAYRLVLRVEGFFQKLNIKLSLSKRLSLVYCQYASSRVVSDTSPGVLYSNIWW